MSLESVFVLASFTAPVEIGTTPASMLLMLPLVAAIAVAYKATKVEKITASNFLKESAILFGSIIVFMGVTALVLYAFTKLIVE